MPSLPSKTSVLLIRSSWSEGTYVYMLVHCNSRRADHGEVILDTVNILDVSIFFEVSLLIFLVNLPASGP